MDIHNPHPIIAAQLIAALAPLRPLFVEEPMPIERVDALAQVARRVQRRDCGRRAVDGQVGLLRRLRTGGLAVLQPDVAHAGGITECKKIAALGEAAYAVVAPHCPLSPISLAATIQLDACLPNFLVQEHNEVLDGRTDGRTTFGAGYLKRPFVLDDEGCVAVPDGPGLGIELDEGGHGRDHGPAVEHTAARVAPTTPDAADLRG